jgi:hypothetical protein
MAKTKYFGYQGDQNFFKKKCENPDCEREFFISGRFERMTKFCSDSCRNHTQYLRRRDNGDSDSTTIEESIHNQTKIETMGMSDEVKEVIRLTAEIGEYKSRISVLQVAAEKLEHSKNEANELRALNHKKDREIQCFRDDLTHRLSEIKRLNIELDELRKEIAELDEEKTELEKTNYDDEEILQETIDDLQNDKDELLWASAAWTSYGEPRTDGGRIKLELIHKHFNPKDYPQDQTWQHKVWDWTFKHDAGANFVLISQNSK